MMKKHLTRNLFTVLFILSILPVSSVMLMNACTAVAPASAESDTISVTYWFDESEILNWLDTKQFTKNLRVLSIAGEPLTPYRVANILLPPYNEVADVSVVEKIGGQLIVKDIPCGQPPAIIGEEPTIVGKNANIYNSDELYPKEIYRVGSVKSFHGYKILNVRLYPVQYKPASKRALYYKEMTVHVKLNEGHAMDTLRNLVKGREAVETLVDNPSVLSTYDSTLVTTETLGTTYEYIIVTTPDLADEFQVLADWKDNFVDGAKVVTVNVDANETEIKNVINDYYTNYNTSYVLLGGDVGVITYHTRYVSVPHGPVGYIAEDYWFANLDGDDEISYYEVYIGRAPVDTEEETVKFVNKIIAYEQMPKPKANLFHQSRATLENYPDTRELAWQCEQYVPPDYINYELFEENRKIEKTDWINFWRNDGIMCEHIGHGNETAYTINYEYPYSHPAGEVRWYNTDVANMDNTFWPVHASVACFSGAFEYEDCLAEAYVKDPDNGAIAALMNDKYGLYSPGDATKPSGDFIEMQFKALYQEGIENVGAILAYSKHCFIDEATSTGEPNPEGWEWCWREINLIGDPETPLLTKRVQPVNIVKNSGWETGDNSFWNVSTIQEPYSSVDYEVNQDSACNGTYGFHVSMETDIGKPLYTTQSLMESQSLSHAMLDTLTELKYRVYPAYELHGVSEIPQARWETIISFSTGNKLHYYGSLDMEPTENSTDKYVYMPITLDQWNEFFDDSVLETYIGKFGTPPIGTVITKIAAYVISKTYAKGNKFNRVIANFDSDEDAEGFQCTPWWVKNFNTGLVYDTIQKAIDANETLDGHTISVMGQFHEHVVVNKSLTLIGIDPSTTIIDGSGTGNVVTVQANSSSIRRFTIQNGQYGIYVKQNSNIYIDDNTVSNNNLGIYLWRSINCSVSSNTVSNNRDIISGTGIMIYNDMPGLGVGNHAVTDNIVIDNYDGIRVHTSRDNVISGNIVANNTYDGIYLDGGEYNNITENWVSNNGGSYHWGIHLWASRDNIIYHNNFINNTVQAYVTVNYTNTWDDGYPSGGNHWSDYEERYPDAEELDATGIWNISYVINEYNIDNYPLVNPWTPAPRTWTVDDDGPAAFHTIQEAVNAANPGDTIYVSSGTYFENVTVNKYNLTLIGEDRSTTIIDGNGTGSVVAVQEKRVRISQFTIQNGDCGIYIKKYIMYTSVSGNTVINNTYGIYLYYSCCNTVSGNTVINNTYGIYVSNGGHNVLQELEFRGHPHPPHPTPGFGNNSISGNTVLNNGNESMGAGIYLFASEDNSICGNIVSNNPYYGICLSISSNTKIAENEISYNSDGLYLDTLQDNYNIIYHNNFINNTNQAYGCLGDTNVWDDGYPSGGNYWSDYAGEDLCSGPYQNETGSDGIGDTPYMIAQFTQDNYSLIHPWGSIRNVDTGLIYLTIQKAIDASETLDGHTIEVKAGTYYEEVCVNKSLTIIGEDPSTTILDGWYTYYDTGFLVYANDTTITGFTVMSYTKCIEIWGCNCKVSGNAFENYKYAIYLETDSSNNIISNNDMSKWDGSYGIYLYFSDGNTISGNLVTHKFIGVYMCYSDQNTITDNTFSYCTIGPISSHSGMYLLESNNNVISGNTITNNEDYGIFLNNANGNTVSNNTISDNENVGIFGGGDDNTIKDNTISNNWHEGIYISWGSLNTVSGNTISNTYHGILLDDNNNIITENTLSNNSYGLYLYPNSNNNVIHHNDFINNTVQAYSTGLDNTWISTNHVGNYWSDYNGTDADGDGIGDTPYVIDANDQDDYPLMWKWFPGDLDGDGYVGSNDLAIFSDAYGSQMGDPNYNKLADLDYDCDVDADDLYIFSQNYGKHDC